MSQALASASKRKQNAGGKTRPETRPKTRPKTRPITRPENGRENGAENPKKRRGFTFLVCAHPGRGFFARPLSLRNTPAEKSTAPTEKSTANPRQIHGQIHGAFHDAFPGAFRAQIHGQIHGADGKIHGKIHGAPTFGSICCCGLKKPCCAASSALLSRDCAVLCPGLQTARVHRLPHPRPVFGLASCASLVHADACPRGGGGGCAPSRMYIARQYIRRQVGCATTQGSPLHWHVLLVRHTTRSGI